jgi:hypothetical protein
MRHRVSPLSVAASVIAGLVLSRPIPSHGADFVVDRADDEPTATACTAATNDCSLRGAILAANALAASATPEASDIAVPAGTYVLSQSSSCTFVAPNCPFVSCTFTSSQVPLCVHADVTIHGDGASATIVDANKLDSVLLVSANSTVEVRGITLTNGVLTHDRYGLGDSGGGVFNEGVLTLTDAAVTESFTDSVAGGIYNAGQLTLVRSAIRFNKAVQGGGILDERSALLTVLDSTIDGNSADLDGAGIFIYGTVVIHGSTISDNTVTGNFFSNGRGGGISLFGLAPGKATLTITNSTLSGNHANATGGALQLSIDGEVHLASVTIAGNSAGNPSLSGGTGGGIRLEGGPSGTVTMRNTLIAGNSGPSAPSDCSTGLGGPLNSEGYNLVQTTDGCTVSGNTTGNLLGVDPNIAVLADNGGHTLTRALLDGSPAIDAGNPAGCTDENDAPIAKDQRGSARAADGDDDGVARCDIGAFELGSSFTIARIQPTEGGNAGSLIVIVRGGGFQPGASVKLVRSGEADIVGSNTTIGPGGGLAMTSFDLTGTTLGAWDVVVTNPDATSVASPRGFTVAAARPPDVWIDIAGPPFVRVGRLFRSVVGTARYTLLYGNRGNTDAYAVPLLFGAADVLGVTPLFDIAPPPQQFGKITIQEFGRFYRSIVAGNDGTPLQETALLLPVVPAGFTGALEVTIVVPGAGSDALPLRFEHGDPLFDVGPKPEAIAKLVDGARDKAARLFGYTISPSIVPAMSDYISTQLDTIVSDGLASLVASFGTAPKVYSLTQLGYDLAAFGMVWGENHAPVLASVDPAPHRLPLERLLARMTAGIADFCMAPALADITCACGVIPKNVSVICCDGCQCTPESLKDPEPPDNCKLEDINKGKCALPNTPEECREIGFQLVSGRDASGNPTSICTNNRKCAFPNSFAPGLCIRFPIKPVRAFDPNDKSGPLGAGDAHFISTDVPLRYTIEFENKPDATAPADEVVITDQLDATLVDLTTLSLGPIDFGSTQVIPPPGLTAFKQDVDLRPTTNLIVRIDAALDAQAASLIWHFTSLDPATMLPPTDPLAGFLPPDKTPPEGSGHVLFTVAAKASLTTGTVIANQAEIVFDTNDPIDTPVWSNTIDVTPPTSQITSVSPPAACAKDLQVSWSGMDDGSGIGTFDVSVSEDGGALTPWITSASTSDTFHGKWGKSYAFQSVARDQAGNVETNPSPPSAPVPVSDCGPHDLAVLKITAPKVVKLTHARPALTVPLVVAIQNRGPHAETIVDATALAGAATLAVDSLAAGCATASVKLHAGKPQKPLPLVLASKQKLNVVFDALFDCAIDKAKGSGHEDFTVSATVSQAALGGIDAHALDDVCPRTVSPPVKDPFPNGKIVEKGCGAKQAGGLGGPVLVDVVVP